MENWGILGEQTLSHLLALFLISIWARRAKTFQTFSYFNQNSQPLVWSWFGNTYSSFFYSTFKFLTHNFL